MSSITPRHQELFNNVLPLRIVQHNDVLPEWENLYKGAYLEWTHDNTSAEAYDCLRVIRAYLKGDGLFSPGDLWTRHLLARCFILEAREPKAGKKQIQLREDALRYCLELKEALSKATGSQMSSEDIEQMEELIKLEQDQFDPEPPEGKFHKLKAKFFGHV